MTPTMINRRLHTCLTMKILFWIVCGSTLLTFQTPTFAAASGRRVVNLSTRANVGTGENVVIAGIIVQGYGTATLVFRGIGPTLAPNVPAGTALADPTLQIYKSIPDSSPVVIAWNNNWRDTQQAELIATGVAPLNDNEAAIKISVAPGTYTAVLSGAAGGTGIGLVEVYDITPQPNSIRLAQISTRAHAENLEGKETLGVIVQGSGNKPVIFRGLGPSIPLPGTLPNPFIALYDTAGLVYYNDNWKMNANGTSQEAQVLATGVAPTNDLESAMPAAPPAGAYTVTMKDVNAATGIAVIEMYDLDPAPTPPPPPPTPTPTPVPTHLVWNDFNLAGAYVGPPVMLRSTNQISAGPGPITVDMTAYAGWLGQIYPGRAAAVIWPRLVNATTGSFVDGFGMSLTGTSQTSPATGMNTFSWTGGNFYIQMWTSSSHMYPFNPDSVIMTHYDVYAPF